MLFFLLLKPEFKGQEKIIEKPLVVFLQDNTSSIVSNSDSTFYKNQYLNKLDSIKSEKKINIDIIPFSSSVSKKTIDFKDQTTNISSVLSEVLSMYANVNVGAYILASDGIYNEGLNPIYSDLYFNAPLYTMLLGDTTKKKDSFIRLVRNNKISYLGNSTPVEILIEAQEMMGDNLRLDVFNHTQDPNHSSSIFSKNIDINSSYYINNFRFFVSPKSSGIQSYYVSLKHNNFEENTLNNYKQFFIDVIDDRKKILLLFSSPHPDVNAIKESLESHDEYEVHSYWCSELNKQKIDFNNHDEYSLVIAHQLSADQQMEELKLFNSTPTWYILGSNSDISEFNKQQNFLKFENLSHSFEYANVTLNKNFSSFLINDSLSDFLSLSTPFLTPFSNVSTKYLSEVLLFKKIGSLNTDQPILFFVENDFKSAFLLGEGLWRWRLNDTYLNDNNNLFNHFIGQVAQYLLLDEDKNRFHINYEPVQKSNKRVFFEAELYNKNFELVNSYDINMSIVDSLNEHYNYKFIPVDDRYYLDIELSDGKYDFISKTMINDEVFTKKGSFIISDFNLESRDLIANYSLLSNLALSNNGNLIQKDSLNQLLDSITNSSAFKPRTYFNYYYQALINFESLLILILFTLFLEWFVRRRYINY